jgi:hypothetical protein
MEQKQEEDSRLMSLEMEYGDDYDDQFDEGGLSSKQPNRNWQEEREKIIRVNKLMLGEEAEEAYWAGMANSNQKGVHVRHAVDQEGGEEEEEEEESGNETKSNVVIKAENKSTQHKKGKPSAAAGGGGGGGAPSTRGPKSKNVKKPAGDPVKESSKGNPKKQQQQSDGAQSHTVVQRKPKTKTFDKHHQKDKNTKKYGGFM